MKEGGRALAAGVDIRVPSGDEENLLGSGAPGLRPFAAFSGSFQRDGAARQRRVSVEREEPAGRRRRHAPEGRPAGSVHLRR